MTLLEAVVALAILALSAVGALDLFSGSAAAAREARAWTALAARAEAGMEAATVVPPSAPSAAPGVTVQVRPWRAGLEEVVVTAHDAGGRTMTLRRLARRRAP